MCKLNILQNMNSLSKEFRKILKQIKDYIDQRIDLINQTKNTADLGIFYPQKCHPSQFKAPVVNKWNDIEIPNDKKFELALNKIHRINKVDEDLIQEYIKPDI